MRALLKALVLAVTLTGCATRVAPVQDASDIRTVAVVVALEDQLTMTYRGWWSVKDEDVPVDWGLRNLFSKKLISELQKKYEIKMLQEDVAPALVKAAQPMRKSNFSTPDDVVAEHISRVRPGQADAIVVVVDKPGATYRYNGSGGGDYPFYIGYFYKMYVFDGKTLALRGNDYGSVHRDRPLPMFEYDQPAIDVDLGWRGEPYASLPDSKKEFVRRGIYALIDKSVPFTLSNRLHLIPEKK